MVIPNLVKAEILFTRRCNLSCPACAMKNSKYNELDLAGWKHAFDGLKEVGIPFAAIYGSEPLCRFEDLCEIIDYAENNLGIMVTVITNGLLMTEKRMIQLYDSGLRSLTMSADDLVHGVDSLPDSVKKKTLAAYNWMPMWMMQPGVRDGQVCMTITRQNLSILPEYIKFWSRGHVWVAWDIMHWSRGQVGSKCSSMTNAEISELCLQDSDYPVIQRVMTEVLEMKCSGKFKIFPFEENIRDWLEWKDGGWTFGKLNWKCRPTTFVTINNDGIAHFCDDLIVEADPVYAWELKNRWQYFNERNVGIMARKVCPGCQWSTHRSAERIFSGQCKLEGYIHGYARA